MQLTQLNMYASGCGVPASMIWLELHWFPTQHLNCDFLTMTKTGQNVSWNWIECGAHLFESHIQQRWKSGTSWLSYFRHHRALQLLSRWFLLGSPPCLILCSALLCLTLPHLALAAWGRSRLLVLACLPALLKHSPPLTYFAAITHTAAAAAASPKPRECPVFHRLNQYDERPDAAEGRSYCVILILMIIHLIILIRLIILGLLALLIFLTIFIFSVILILLINLIHLII